MIEGLYIKEDKNVGRYCIASAETFQPVSIDMEYDEAVEFLRKMYQNKLKASAIPPDAPRLYYNRWEPGFGKSK
jgi:hypothetical protein